MVEDSVVITSPTSRRRTKTCDEFFFKLIRGTDEDAEWELWGETLYDQSDPIAAVIEHAGDKRREILLSHAA